MWNRNRKEEDFTPKPVGAPPPAPSVLAKEGIPMSLPSRPPESHHEGGRSAVLGKSVILKGQIISREDLTIDGEVEGSVELKEHRLTIGPNGRVKASVKARELVVIGTIHGDVEITDKIDIRREAKLVGDIKTARVVIEDGAYFKGNIDIVRQDANRPAPTSTLAPAPASAAASTPAPKPAAAASGASASSSSAVAAGAADGKR
jgi:cytoskeletal protein CcmA (bactofilin family)